MTMRVPAAPLVCLVAVCAALAAGARPAAARPTVAIAGVEVAGDSVGVDVESVAIARELTQALRRAADRADGPLQLVDPMVRADDVEALVWGKLLRDGDSWVATVHLSAVGADGDTVSYRAVITRARTSAVELGRWGTVIYDSLLEQIDLDDGDGDATPGVAAGARPTAATTGTPGGTSGDPFTLRTPSRTAAGDAAAQDDLIAPDPGDVFADRGSIATAAATVTPDAREAEPAFELRRDRGVAGEPLPHANARRLFWISAGIAGAGALLWTYSAFRVSDAEDQIDRLAGCTGCDRAIEAANAQGNRWEGISWLAGTATIAGVAAAVLFGYQGYIIGREPRPGELVGTRRARRRAVTVAPAIGPDRVGAAMAVSF